MKTLIQAILPISNGMYSPVEDIIFSYYDDEFLRMEYNGKFLGLVKIEYMQEVINTFKI